MTNEKLARWQEILTRDESAWSAVASQFDGREALYFGAHSLKPIVEDDPKTTTPYCRNIVCELIEAQVDPSVPQPKVSAETEAQEELAKIVEDKLRNELDRMTVEAHNDLMERIVRIQGGGFYLVEWDNAAGGPGHVGELCLTPLHPKQIVPQAGVYTGIQDMEHICVKLPQTKEKIWQKYHVDVYDEPEEAPEVRGAESTTVSDLVTQNIMFHRNKKGGIGLYSWVNDKELCDLEDYQARRLPRCRKCGQLWTDGFEVLPEPTLDGSPPAGGARKAEKGVCPYCGSKAFEETEEEAEEIWLPVRLRNGTELPGAELKLTESEPGVWVEELVPNRIPFYKPDVFPVILLRNVSVYGKLLGESDVDRIADQQNTINRLNAKILDILLKSGSYMAIPDDPGIKLDAGDMKPWRVGDIADMQKFQVLSMTADISQLVAFRQEVYEEARQQLGITDSFQGRKDSTAQSGIAKQFSAQQAEGRLLSKRVAKAAGWSMMFEVMFKFLLAYTDEARPVVRQGITGEPEYDVFSRYDFLKRDKNGAWYWDDRLLFAVDESAPLASNRSAMWQEVTAFYQAGAFGDPTQTATQILFWEKMDFLHYPGASDTKKYLQEKQKQEQAAAVAAAQMQREAMKQQEEAEREKQAYEVQRQARQDAERTAQTINSQNKPTINPSERR
jgi:hypothetical protein